MFKNEMTGMSISHFFSLLFLSAGALSYELILMRLFSVIQWYHLAYMVISLALLGFAASATLLAIIQKRKKSTLTETQCTPIFSSLSFLFLITSMGVFYVVQTIPFSPFQLVWQKNQFIYLSFYYILFFVPFFLTGLFVGLSFMCFKKAIGSVYFFNLLGSGIGVIASIFSFYLIPPQMCPVVSGIFGFLGLLFSYTGWTKIKAYVSMCATSAVFIFIFLINNGIHLQMSPYKGIKKALLIPGSSIEYERYSAQGLIQVVGSPALRSAPGLSLTYRKGTPPQREIFIDGNPYGHVTTLKDDLNQLEYLDYSTFALAYHLIIPHNVLIFNPSGGDQPLAALYNSSVSINVVDPYHEIVAILKGSLKTFSQNIGNDNPNIRLTISSPREFIARHPGLYNIIQLGLIGSWGGLGTGIYATGGNYTFTAESFDEYFSHLSPNGILSTSAWLSSPPRVFLKLLALCIETLERNGHGNSGLSIVAIRSWATGTVVIKKGEFSSSEIGKIKDFCRKRAFDLVYYPSIKSEEVNKFSIMKTPVYYEFLVNLLNKNKDERREIFKGYPFNIKPPSDDKPYFFHFFKLSSIKYLAKTLGREWIPFLEWGYVIMWATLFQALMLGPLFVFLPLLFIKKRHKPSLTGKGAIFLYFSLIGLAFMFIEMALIQKSILLVAHPISALALILFTLMSFSGIGSLASRKLGASFRWIPIAGILFFVCIYVLTFDGLLKILLPYSNLCKYILIICPLAPMAFFMGMPFPVGLQIVSDKDSNYIPWVWGVNGVASVIAPVAGGLLNVTIGFQALMLISLLLYAFAGCALYLIPIQLR